MKRIFTLSQFILLVCFLYANTLTSQVGIGTTTPDQSSILHLNSTTQGLLTPRMTTVQRNAIATPADGLLVYDTDLKSMYCYNSGIAVWTVINSGTNGRLKFKRIKSTDVLTTVLAAEKAAGGANYKLDSGTYYEINGNITVDAPIELNNAYIVGLDVNEDKLISSGSLFVGATGGTIKNLTITAGTAFTLSGANTENLIFRDCIISGCTSVGSIGGFGLVFASVVQYVGNTTGITYNNITRLLLNNMAWFGNNAGTFEKLTGSFTLIQKLGGFYEVNGSAIGIDVSGNPTITADAVMESVIFTGSNTAGFVKAYTAGTYTGYSFSNDWRVICAGIPNESDGNAVGLLSIDYAVGSGASTPFSGVNPTAIKKVVGVSNPFNLFRFSTGGDSNKLIYLGKKKRFFQVTGSISFQVPAIGTYIIYIAKKGTPITEYKIYGRGAAANDIVVLPINALVELSNGDYVEVFVQRYASTGSTDSIITPNMTLVLK